MKRYFPLTVAFFALVSINADGAYHRDGVDTGPSPSEIAQMNKVAKAKKAKAERKKAEKAKKISDLKTASARLTVQIAESEYERDDLKRERENEVAELKFKRAVLIGAAIPVAVMTFEQGATCLGSAYTGYIPGVLGSCLPLATEIAVDAFSVATESEGPPDATSFVGPVSLGVAIYDSYSQIDEKSQPGPREAALSKTILDLKSKQKGISKDLKSLTQKPSPKGVKSKGSSSPGNGISDISEKGPRGSEGRGGSRRGERDTWGHEWSHTRNADGTLEFHVRSLSN